MSSLSSWHDVLYLAYRGQINDELLLVVHPHQPVHELLMVGSHGARSRPDGLTGQVQILADVPGVQGNDLVGGQPVAPLHAVRDGRPDEDHG